MTSHYVTIVLIIIVCLIFPVFIPLAIFGGVIGLIFGFFGYLEENAEQCGEIMRKANLEREAEEALKKKKEADRVAMNEYIHQRLTSSDD